MSAGFSVDTDTLRTLSNQLNGLSSILDWFNQGRDQFASAINCNLQDFEGMSQAFYDAASSLSNLLGDWGNGIDQFKTSVHSVAVSLTTSASAYDQSDAQISAPLRQH